MSDANKKGPRWNADQDNIERPEFTRNPCPASTDLARAVLDQHFAGGSLKFFDGEFYQWAKRNHLGYCYYEMSRRALAPFVFQTMQAQGMDATSQTVRETMLALSALPDVLTTDWPRPQFCDLQGTHSVVSP